MDQPGKGANPARGQLNREHEYSRACLIIWSRETGSAVPSRVSLLIFILRLNLMGWRSRITIMYLLYGVHNYKTILLLRK